MIVSYAKPDVRYLAFIDEAGEPGLTKVHPIDDKGSSEWLVMAALLVRVERERDLLDWVRNIRREIGSHQAPSLHYRTLTHERKAVVCTRLAQLPLRGFVMLSNKKNMKGHKNERVETARGASTQQYFYNWCTRLLLERATDFVEQISKREHKEPKHVKLVFSERGGMRYSQTIEYLDLLRSQAQSNTTFLTAREVKWAVLNAGAMESVPHARSPGAQLADAVASAFFQSVNTSGQGSWDPSHARLLRPCMWKVAGQFEEHGVSLQPRQPKSSTPYARADLNDRQVIIFRDYGFRI